MIQAIRTGGFFHTRTCPARGETERRTAREGGRHGKRDPGPAGQQGQTDPQQAAADPQQAQGGSEGKDYKALYEEAVKESRKWEKRSKENLAQLNGLKESQGKPDPTIEERIAALEKENGDLKAASARAALVDSVAKATGLDRAIVATLSGADEDELTEQAEAIAAIAKATEVASVCTVIYEVSLTAQLSGTIVHVLNGPVAQRWSRGLIILWFSVRIRVGPPQNVKRRRETSTALFHALSLAV